MLRAVCATVLALCALRRVASGATTFTVDRQDDSASATACTAAPNDCSLRGAIVAANASAGPDTINLPAGSYTLSIPGAAEDMAATGDLDIRDDLTLIGAGAATTVIDGGQLDRVIHSDPAGTGIAVTISGVTIQHGKTEVIAFVLSDGGGVRNGSSGTQGNNTGGTLTIMNSVIKDNTTPRGGGGIGNVGTLILADSTVSGNTAGTNGGGILQDDPGSMSIARTTISGNQAGQGGGIFSGIFSITADPALTVSDSTLSGNTSAIGAGIFYNRGTLTLTNVTVSDNTGTAVARFSAAASLRSCTVAGNTGVGIDASVKAVLRNTIVAGNSGGSGADCSGTIDSAGYNLIQTVGCTIMGDATGNVIGQDPLLGALGNNDGPTMTRALPPGSPAVDKANPAAPGSGGNACEQADQRGTTRPQPTGGRCDIGAFELVPPATTTTTTVTTTTAPTTTTTTTVTTTTTTLPSTTTTTTSSTSTTGVSTTTTTTTTTPPSTTTTTLAPGGCDGVPLAPPGFRSIDCRLAGLLARVNGDSRLGTFQSKLAGSVERARSVTAEAAALCGQSNLKKTKKHLQQAGTAITQYLHRLRGLAARKKLDHGVRESFIADGDPIQGDLKAFRGAVRCPDDAA